jgi:hypothetical protein
MLELCHNWSVVELILMVHSVSFRLKWVSAAVYCPPPPTPAVD